METTSLTNCMSANVSEIALALSEFQGSIQKPSLEKEVEVKTKTGYTYKCKYADLSTCSCSLSKGEWTGGNTGCQCRTTDYSSPPQKRSMNSKYCQSSSIKHRLSDSYLFKEIHLLWYSWNSCRCR